MSFTTFIEAPFIANYRHCSGGDVQVLGIGSPYGNPRNRQVIFWNREKELFIMPLEDFMRDLPNGVRKFRPLNDAFELLQMIQVAPIKGQVGPRKNWDNS